MDYKDLKNVARVRIYRTIYPDLPIEQWKLVSDTPGSEIRFNDDLKDEPKVPHYYRAQFLYKDGKLSGLSEPTVARPDLVVEAGKPRKIDKGSSSDHFKIEYRKPE